MSLNKSVESQKSAQPPATPSKLIIALFTNQVTTAFLNFLCTTMDYTSVLRSANFSRINSLTGKLIRFTLVISATIVSINLNAADKEIESANSLLPAKRIVALSPHSVEMLFAIGAENRIIGTVEYADYPEAAKSIPRIGSYHGIQIENLLALKPDLVIGWKGGNKSSDLSKLKSLGLNIVYSQPKTINDINSELLELGRLTGLTENASRVVAKLQTKYHGILARYKSQKSVDVFYQLWHDPLQSVGKNSWIQSLIEDCGGNNIFKLSDAPYPLVTLESVLVKNPKVIIIPGHSGNADEFSEKKKIWEKWPEISAVKNNKIFAMNGDLLHRFTPRALEGLELLCQRIDEGR
ncbi:MAG: cobalamin-binding protein [Kangiellaceae bacterium]|nr:cobalamin-binding protein [Kangiellaceae bacterium]